MASSIRKDKFKSKNMSCHLQGQSQRSQLENFGLCCEDLGVESARGGKAVMLGDDR